TTGAGVRSGAALPVRTGGSVTGVVELLSTDPQPLPAHRLAALRPVARLLGLCLDQLAAVESTREQAADTAAVVGVLQAVLDATSVDEAVRAALDAVRSAFGWAYGSYWAVDPADRVLRFGLESGSAGAEFRKVTLE